MPRRSTRDGRGAAQAAAELADRAVALTPPDAIDQINRRRITAAEHWFYAGDGKKATALLEEAVGSSKPGPTTGRCALRARAREHGDGRKSHSRRHLSTAHLRSPVSRSDSAPHPLRARVPGDRARREPRRRPLRGRRAGACRATGRPGHARPQPGDGRRDHVLAHRAHPARPARPRDGDRAESSAAPRIAAGPRDGARPRVAARPIRPSRRSARLVAPADRRGVRARRSRRRHAASSSWPGWRWRPAPGTRLRDCATRRWRSVARPAGRCASRSA